MKRKYKIGIAGGIAVAILVAAFWGAKNIDLNPNHAIGDIVDSLDGVLVYYNGGVNHVSGRNLAADGYNIGLKYQCVEFVKRYYYQHYSHKMPDSYGHAKDFFDHTCADNTLNTARNLTQYHNPSSTKPQKGDLLVFGPTAVNPYGHVAILSEATDSEVEIVQQNPGTFASSRKRFSLHRPNGQWHIGNDRILGWLRIPMANAGDSDSTLSASE